MARTPREQEAFLWMQGRLVELLLRYDVPSFGKTFAEQIANGLDDERLRPYRELAVLFHLRDELFERILPRVKRRLSFVAPRETRVEALPSRGRIDWSRTLDDNLRHSPGEPPLSVYTRQRRRHFATPENLLVVATILEYQAAVQRILDAETSTDRTQALRHPLHGIADRCTRELVFPQFAGLVREATTIVEGRSTITTAELEHQVTQTLLPGSNSAYDELITWRRRLQELTFTQRDAVITGLPTFGANPEADNRLYQLWIFFEVLDLVRLKGWSGPDDLSLKTMRLQFTIEGCRYELCYNQKVPQPVASWAIRQRETKRVPGVIPDYYIWRIDPPIVTVRDGGSQIWRESGIVWDAKYYRERETSGAPSLPIKRMIADLALLGETYGVLLFAFLKEAVDQQESYQLSPDRDQSQTLVPNQTVMVAQVTPAVPKEGNQFHAILQALLLDAHRRLQKPADIRCHGVFLDALSVTAHGSLAGIEALRRRDGSDVVAADLPAEAAIDTLLLCPKPHIGPWRMDIVSLERDCCKNASVCHIAGAGSAGVQPPSRLRRLEDIANAIRAVESEEDAERTEAATRQVRLIAQRYADLIQPDLAHFTAWVRAELEVEEKFEQFPFLTDSHRETLGLGRFLWEQIDAIRANNFAGPTLLFTGVLEELVRNTVFNRCPQLNDQNGRPLPKTLGTVGNQRNRAIIVAAMRAGSYWDAQLSGTNPLPFDDWADLAWRISRIRNQAAHEAFVSGTEFRELQRLYFGSKRTGLGALNGLMLAWREPDQRAP